MLTTKLKLQTTPTQAEQLRRTALAYRDALNYTSSVAFTQGKLSQAFLLQKRVYRDLRTRFGLSAQLACNAPRQVAATYKGLWIKVMQNAEHRRRGFTKRRYKGLDKPPKYVALTTTFSYGYDYRFKSDQQLSITTLTGRLVLPYVGYTPHLATIKAGRQFDEVQKARKRPERKLTLTEEQEDDPHAQAIEQSLLASESLTEPAVEETTGITFGAAKLWRDPRTKQWYLLVTLALPLPEIAPDDLPQTQGIDLGQRYLAVSTTATNQTQFIAGGHAVHQGEALPARETAFATKRHFGGQMATTSD
ncbi:MAG: hypothetical protein H0X24_16640, partial [Ktedonobacterales bacterium]|nr:hypothetical protein [Ktedonobacterales bacterium]